MEIFLLFIDYLLSHLKTIVTVTVLLMAGIFLARFVRNRLHKIFHEKKENATVKLFFIDFIYATLLIILAITTLTELGVPTGSLLTLLGTGGIAIALAMKNSLSDIANGILIVIQQPFKIGDLVKLSGVTGTVYQINLFTTQLKTGDHEMVFIPNGKVMSDKMINIAYRGIRRLTLKVSISYDENIKNASEILLTLVRKHEKILKSPEPAILVDQFGDSGIELAIRIWAKKSDYETIKSELLEQIKNECENKGIEVPFPQIEVTLKKPIPAEPQIA